MRETAKRVTIGTVELVEKFYQDQRVVTFADIAHVHGVPQKNIERSFREHCTRFAEGKHTYLLDFAEASQLLFSVGVSPNGVRIFTELGYLMLVKPMRDDMAWQVQERMVDDYFRLREMVTAQASAQPMSEVDKLALVLGIKWPQLEQKISDVISDNQRTDAKLEDHRVETAKKFNRVDNEKASKREVIELKKTVESIATVAAGPHLNQGRAQNDVYNFVLDQSHLHGWERQDGRALEPKRPYFNRFKAHMRHCCAQVSEGVSHRTNDGGIGYNDQVYWQSDLMEVFESKMGGVEQLRKEIEDEEGPASVRVVKNPKTYDLVGHNR